jgi:hypothetical protein
MDQRSREEADLEQKLGSMLAMASPAGKVSPRAAQ